MMLYLDELKSLNLPENKYVIVGSGPIAVRGVRNNSDIDIVVEKSLWKKLCKKFRKTPNKEELQLTEHIFAYFKWWKAPVSTDKMIAEAERIEGLPFVKLEYMIEYKRKMNRFKDILDLQSINIPVAA